MEKRILKPYHGILFFVIAILALIFPGAIMQAYWGMAGLAVSEIMYLVISVVYVLILRGDLKEVFPLKKIKVTVVIGTILLWVGTYPVIMLLSMIITALFPEQILATSQGLNSVFSQVSVPMQIIIVALLPAICEEAMHRGVILNSFKNIRSKWIVIIATGVLFGINHLSIWRFLPTAILGIALTYVVYETGNIFYSVLFHFLNNAFSTLATAAGDSSAVSVETSLEIFHSAPIMCVGIGLYMIFSAIAPFLIYTAAYLVRLGKSSEEKVTYWPERHKGWMIGILIGLTVLCVAGGFMLTLLGACMGSASML